MRLNGSSGQKPNYLPRSERSDFDSARSKKARNYLRCEFTNYSRVPLLNVSVYVGVDYHHHSKHKAEHNLPFSAIGPGQSRAIWIMNGSNEAVTVATAHHAKYACFPKAEAFQVQKFLPALTDYWVLVRDAEEPVATLDPRVMM
jgi:hypothetical protein